ncbi:hypothetical protein ACHAWF_003587, partial [Thalassiosira exigua]
MFQRFLHNKRLRRFIDDLFGIWICDECNNPAQCRHWNQFQTKLNNFGVLRWTINEPSKQCVFLDLSIKIDGHRNVTCTYQKPTKLALYLPGSSAHPAGMIKGTIFGLLRRYYKQNT